MDLKNLISTNKIEGQKLSPSHQIYKVAIIILVVTFYTFMNPILSA